MGLAVNQERKPRGFKSLRLHHLAGVPEWQGAGLQSRISGVRLPSPAQLLFSVRS